MEVRNMTVKDNVIPEISIVEMDNVLEIHVDVMVLETATMVLTKGIVIIRVGRMNSNATAEAVLISASDVIQSPSVQTEVMNTDVRGQQNVRCQ